MVEFALSGDRDDFSDRRLPLLDRLCVAVRVLGSRVATRTGMPLDEEVERGESLGLLRAELRERERGGVDAVPSLDAETVGRDVRDEELSLGIDVAARVNAVGRVILEGAAASRLPTAVGAAAALRGAETAAAVDAVEEAVVGRWEEGTAAGRTAAGDASLEGSLRAEAVVAAEGGFTAEVGAEAVEAGLGLRREVGTEEGSLDGELRGMAEEEEAEVWRAEVKGFCSLAWPTPGSLHVQAREWKHSSAQRADGQVQRLHQCAVRCRSRRQRKCVHPALQTATRQNGWTLWVRCDR